MADAKKPTHEQLQKAKAILTERLKGRQDITGIDVGFRRKGGKRTDERCLRVHVKQKIARAELAQADLLPTKVEGRSG